MQLPDVNILLRAYNVDDPHHAEFRVYLESLLSGSTPFGMSDLVLSSFLRIATGRTSDGRAIFRHHSDIATAMAFATQIRTAPGWVRVEPGPSHWSIFESMCRDARTLLLGKLVPDAYFAALA